VPRILISGLGFSRFLFALSKMDMGPAGGRGATEREKFITRQPPIGGKDDYDGENSWISDG